VWCIQVLYRASSSTVGSWFWLAWRGLHCGSLGLGQRRRRNKTSCPVSLLRDGVLSRRTTHYVVGCTPYSYYSPLSIAWAESGLGLSHLCLFSCFSSPYPLFDILSLVGRVHEHPLLIAANYLLPNSILPSPLSSPPPKSSSSSYCSLLFSYDSTRDPAASLFVSPRLFLTRFPPLSHQPLA
jgi:hypothetical protein